MNIILTSHPKPHLPQIKDTKAARENHHSFNSGYEGLTQANTKDDEGVNHERNVIRSYNNLVKQNCREPQLIEKNHKNV